jgi:ribosomal-protein-alanine N-acetyltransferase
MTLSHTDPSGFSSTFQRAVERMSSGHLREVLEIEVNCFPEPWSRALFLGEMANPVSHCFIIQSTVGFDTGVRGFLCFRNVEDESELLKLAVHPGHRRKGFGRMLMDFYVEFCRERDVHRLYLEVNSLNLEALSLYEAVSYRRVGLRQAYYQHQFDALLMSKEV